MQEYYAGELSQNPIALFVFESCKGTLGSDQINPVNLIKHFCYEVEQTTGETLNRYCTVLEVDEREKRIAESLRITLVSPKRMKRSNPERDPPRKEWLFYHEQYYQSLKELSNVRYVVGFGPETQREAEEIHEILFPDSELRILNSTSIPPLPAALLVFKSWDKDKFGLQQCQRALVQEFCARKANPEIMKVYCTTLDVELSDAQKADASEAGVTLITATRKCSLGGSEDDPPSVKWLLNHESYFQKLKDLRNIQYIVGYAPMTADAAVDIKNKLFPHAKLYLINHKHPQDPHLSIPVSEKAILEETMQAAASKADAVVSMGPSMYEYFDNVYRAVTEKDIAHIELLPKPCRTFFEADVKTPKQSGRHTILTYGEVDRDETFGHLEKLAAHMSAVAMARVEVNKKPPNWKVHGVSPHRDEANLSKLADKLKYENINPSLSQGFSAEKLLTHLKQCHLCLTATGYVEFGLNGLEAMATGVPIAIPDDSQLADFIEKYLAQHGDCVVRSNVSLKDRILKVMNGTDIAFVKAKELKRDFLECEDVEMSHGRFAALFTPETARETTSTSACTTLSSTITLDCSKMDGGNGCTCEQYNAATRNCQAMFDRTVHEVVNDPASYRKVQTVVKEKFDAQVETMKQKCLDLALNLPKLLSLYKYRGSCRSGSFAKALEPLLITDEMKQESAKVGMKLMLRVSYSEEEFKLVEKVFITRDGGGVRSIFSGRDQPSGQTLTGCGVVIEKEDLDGKSLHDKEDGVRGVTLKTSEFSAAGSGVQITANGIRVEETSFKSKITEEVESKETSDGGTRGTTPRKNHIVTITETQTEKKKTDRNGTRHPMNSRMQDIRNVESSGSESAGLDIAIQDRADRTQSDAVVGTKDEKRKGGVTKRRRSLRSQTGQSSREPRRDQHPKRVVFHKEKLIVCDANSVKILAEDYTCDKVIGSFDGQFKNPFQPCDVSISPDNQFFTIDKGNSQIVVYNDNNDIVKTIPLAEDIDPSSICLVGEFVYISDKRGHRILKYTVSGEYLGEVWGKGSGKLQFDVPYYLSVSIDNSAIIVSDHLNHSVKWFDFDLKYKHQFGSRGTEDGQLLYPAGIATDNKGNVYICDNGNARIVKVTADGKFSCNLFQGDVVNPRFIAVCNDGRVALTESASNQIKVLSINHGNVSTFTLK
ncbi:uncharacterized protein [Ptychodera flava]|uniref:uncharacterized protein n=1 Tax=Ptychodera flava TaxID=63121 RepID=UPI00396A379B